MPHQIYRRGQRPQRQYKHLSPDQIATWMQYGFVKVPQAFTRGQCSDFTKDLWVRLGFDPNDMSTWTRDMTWMAWHKDVEVSDFAPKAWGAICDIVGGEERIAVDDCGSWSDSFIVNLGKEEFEGQDCNIVDEVDGWHVDGDHFVHFLDSPEQGLLVVPLFSDVLENGGGTVICPDGIPKIAKWLHDHPGGVDESLVPLGQKGEFEDRWITGDFVEKCHEFFELTGEVGDVFILHPLMIHSASKNALRVPRFITNPHVALKQPFNFNRPDSADYSLIELKTMRDLGSSRLEGWQITGERRPLVKEGNDWEEKQRSENERLDTFKSAESYHLQLAANSSHGMIPPTLPPRLRT